MGTARTVDAFASEKCKKYKRMPYEACGGGGGGGGESENTSHRREQTGSRRPRPMHFLPFCPASRLFVRAKERKHFFFFASGGMDVAHRHRSRERGPFVDGWNADTRRSGGVDQVRQCPLFSGFPSGIA